MITGEGGKVKVREAVAVAVAIVEEKAGPEREISLQQERMEGEQREGRPGR